MKLKLSEGTDTNHSHHHYVANRCQHSNPQPNGVTGHFPIILCFWGSRAAGVQVGGGRLQGRVAVIGRIHEGPAHSRVMLSRRETRFFRCTLVGINNPGNQGDSRQHQPTSVSLARRAGNSLSQKEFAEKLRRLRAGWNGRVTDREFILFRTAAAAALRGGGGGGSYLRGIHSQVGCTSLTQTAKGKNEHSWKCWWGGF